MENTFNPAQISCLVTEEFENNIKTNVSIKNTGNTDAYIRAAVIVTWVDNDGNVYATAPQVGTDYNITFSDNWLSKKTDFITAKLRWLLTEKPRS